MVCERLNFHIKGLLPSTQHGFRARSSTEQATPAVKMVIQEVTDRQCETSLIFVDF